MSPADVFAGFQEAGQAFFAVSGWMVGAAVLAYVGFLLFGWSLCRAAGRADDHMEICRMRAERVAQRGGIPDFDGPIRAARVDFAPTDTFIGTAAWPGREGR